MLKGKDGAITIGSSPENIGAIQSWTLDESADVVAGWGMGDNVESAFATVTRASGSFEVYEDPTDPSGDIEVGATYPLNLYPGGQSSGSGYFSLTALITSVGRSGSKDGIPTRTFNFRTASGAVSENTVT